MRRMILIGAAVVTMIPAAINAQSTGASGSSGTDQSSPMTGQPGNAQADQMGDTANPTASDTHSRQNTGTQTSSGMSADTASSGSGMNKTYPMCSRTVRDACRNRGGR
jgi:hypothetical protein